MITCTRRLKFDAGHRVLGHATKCGHLHGHQYIVLVTVAALQLDSLGMVIDFSIVKDLVGGWIDANWDHGLILHEDDTQLLAALTGVPASSGDAMKIFTMGDNPTAENLANYLLTVVCPHVFLGTRVVATRVVVQETENCAAEASLDDH